MQCFYTIMTVFMGTGFNFGPTYCSRLAVFFKQRDHRFYKPAGASAMTPARLGGCRRDMRAVRARRSAHHGLQRRTTLPDSCDPPPCADLPRVIHVPARPQPGAPPC